MGRKLTYRKPRYQLSERIVRAIERRLPPKSRGEGLRFLLLYIGQWCVDNATDGHISEAAMRRNHPYHYWRTAQRYIRLFVKEGILRELGGREYVVCFFDEYHPPAWLQEARIAERRAKGRYRTRKCRGALSQRDSESAEKTRGYPPCNTIPTGITEVQTSTNQRQPSPITEHPPEPRRVSCLKSIVDEGPPDDSFWQSLARLAAEAEPESVKPPPRPASPAPEPKPGYRPKPRKAARMPKEQRPANEGDVGHAIKALGLPGDLTADLFGELHRMRATDAEVGYALKATQHGKDVRHRDRYLIGAIENQRKLRRGVRIIA